MPSDKQFVDYIIDQMELAGLITIKQMMGEYLLYCDGVYVALVSDNKLFVKPTESGRKFIGKTTELPAYPGAKPSFYIESQLEDRKWIGELIRVTCRELSKTVKPAKKIKTTKRKRKS